MGLCTPGPCGSGASQAISPTKGQIPGAREGHGLSQSLPVGVLGMEGKPGVHPRKQPVSLEGMDRAPRLRQRDSGSPEDMRPTPTSRWVGPTRRPAPPSPFQGQGQGWLVFDPQCSAKQ